MKKSALRAIYGVRLAVYIAAVLLIAGSVRIEAQGCTEPSFTAAAPAAVGSYPAAITSGDLNGDGNLDLAVANYFSSDVSVLLGNGNGAFAPAVNFGNVSSPFAIVSGDLDGDDDIDLAVVNSSTDDVTVLKGDGLGAFTFAGRFAVGILPFSIAIADLNADGNLDLATANYFSNNVTVLIGDGLGGFAPASEFSAGNTPIAIAAGDFDQNGTIDLAAVNYISDSVSILDGDGSGGFSVSGSYAVGSFPSTLAVGDLNSDGKLDLAVANESGAALSVLVNNATGGFNAATNWPTGSTPFGVVIGDFNQDGRQDIANANYGSGNISVLRGTGGGNFAPAVNFGVGSQPGGLVIGDLNGDESRDLAVTNSGSNNVSILLNDCAGNAAPVISPIAVSRQEGSASLRSSIATVGDTEDPPATLNVTVNGGTSATVNSVTVSNITVDAAGNAEADVVASCGAGNASFTLRVTDSGGLYAEAELNVTVTASDPPVIVLHAPISLFPHNGKLREISVSQMVQSATDGCDGDVSGNVVIEKVTSDEVGDKDIFIGADCRSVQLRATRDNHGDGRVYSVTLRVTDSSGNTTRADYKVTVPLTPNGEPAVEGPPLATVLSSCP